MKEYDANALSSEIDSAGFDGCDTQTHPGIGFRLSRISRILRTNWAIVLQEFDLSPPQAAILRVLLLEGAQGIRELGRALALDPMNLKRYLEILVQKGYVSMPPFAERGKKRMVSILPEGELAATLVLQKVNEQDLWFQKILGDEETDRLVALLSVLETQLL